MDDILTATLRGSIDDHLASVEHLITDGEPQAHLAVVEGQIHRLINAMRGLLAEHDPDPRTGRCPTCSTGWHRRRCTILTTTHRHLHCADRSIALHAQHARRKPPSADADARIGRPESVDQPDARRARCLNVGVGRAASGVRSA